MSSLDQVPDPEVPAKARTRRWSAAEKARILAEYENLGKADKGALMRREGIYSSLIAAWRAQRDQGARRGGGHGGEVGEVEFVRRLS